MSTVDMILKTLNSTNAVLTSGFLIGFTYELKFSKKTLQYPLSTLFNSVIGGFITFLGASLLHDFIPPNLRFIVPVLATASCLYYKYNDLKKKD